MSIIIKGNFVNTGTMEMPYDPKTFFSDVKLAAQYGEKIKFNVKKINGMLYETDLGILPEEIKSKIIKCDEYI